MRHLLPLLALLLLAPSVHAAESEAVRSPRAVASLVAEAAAVAPGQPFRVGLRLRLAPGWHSYWRNAGDAGAAPEVALTLPEGATAGPIEWPAPSRIAYGPLVNFGYEGEVLLPLRVTPPPGLAPGTRFTVEAEASWLVCEQLCIPEEGRFRLDLPVAATGSADAGLAALFTATEAATPRASPWPARAALAGSRGSLTLAGEGLAPGRIREAFFFPAEGGLIENAAPQPLRLGDGTLTLALTRPEGAALPATLEGVVALVDAAGVRSTYAVAAPVGGVPETAAPALPLGQALLWAFLGGLLLNLMPCVFPVLAMKAMALARLSGAARVEVRAHAASYTLGVLATFLALAGLLIGLRAGGVAAGWGFQFTAPAFVAALAWLMLAVGLNLSGVYDLGRTVGAGGALAARGGHAGSFATGALAVLVATPCTAPFMAAAIGTALALPAAATLAVFAALGLGLAAPYALLGLFPGLAGLLPRPGGWMERLRQGLAFPMYGAAAWLAWVLAQQAGPEGLAFLLAGAVLTGFAAWALGVAQRSAGGGRRAGRALAGVAALAALALLPGLAAAPPPAAAAEAGAEPWSATRVAALQAEGRPVLVNLTAAWCITCQVNERLVLRGAAVQAAFASRNLAYLKGDWTNGDAAIGALLREHGREGVPLYLLFPAGGGAPAVLPQVLTEGIVLRALAEG
ncbi:thiol:disulfide interchange protein DsbD [Siccirubricoccus deserti]|uniref:Thioredoxin family protein n=1 Tax=Siccirubricoccus deserti TaxID=2013562 RepID=A0A9X0QV38_9PROT|nr:protein-disulfide reductase DsbD domain-containing protein [Siccirubricoccus deserti]MBC4014391.1 thioredoxin family protein [Siccirubricoccus deserti]GGC33217.1 thiol:disulfide interchange protein DsbD [Siccirubricoccus deserti]